MVTTVKALIEAKFLVTGDTTQYTAENCKTSIDKFTAVNTTNLNVAVTVHIIPAGGASDASNQISINLPGLKSWPFPELVGHILEPGDSLTTACGTADAVWIRASGREIT